MKRKSLLFTLLAALFMPIVAHAQQSLPYSCGFEDGDDLTGWQIQGGPSNAGLYNTDPYEGSVHWGFNYQDPDCYLVSPILTGGDQGVVVSFYYKSYSSSYPDCFKVGYTTDESVTDASAFTYGETIFENNSTWTEYNNTFPAGTKRIAVMYLNNNGDGWYLWLDAFNFTAAGAAVCDRPTDFAVSEVGSRTATLSWTSTASSWQLCINDDESNLINVGQNPYTLTGLTPATAYTVKLRANCGSNSVSAWTSASFTTEEACPTPAPTVTDITSTTASINWTGNANSYSVRYREQPGFNYGFETATAWVVDDFAPCTTYDGDGLPTYGINNTSMPNANYVGSVIAFQNGLTTNVTAHSGNACGGFFDAIPDSGAGITANNDWFILPEITIANGDIFSFWAREFVTTYGAEVMNVGIYGSTDGTFAATLAENVQVASTEWTEYSYDLSAYVGQTIRLAINCVSSDVFALFFDDIFVGNLNAAWTTVNNATSPYSLTGLTPETTYEVQVQAVCGGQDGSSQWATTTFTTLPSCVAPSNLVVSDITTTSAVVSWAGPSRVYNLKVNDQTYNNVTSPYTLSGLTAATQYTVEVQSVCSASSTSTWTSTNFLTTLCEAEDMCEITFELTDSYGDTWNGNQILVVDVETMTLIDAVTNDYDNYAATGASGAYTVTKTVSVCNGRTVQFMWYAGSYPGEASWVIRDVNGDEITSGIGNTSMSTYDILYTYTVDCTATDCHKPTNVAVTEIGANTAMISWTENGEATSWMVSYGRQGGRPTTITTSNNPHTLNNLAPETVYSVTIRPNGCTAYNSNTTSNEITFTTEALCPLPSDITVETEPESATLSWTGSTDSYNIRYRISATVGFEDGTLSDWTTIDADGDGNTWYALNTIPGNNGSTGLATSASYNNGVLTPDNYLVSPQVTLGGSISFYACAQDASWPAEHFGVAVSTTGNTDASDFITIAEWTLNADGTGTEGPAREQGVWGLFTVDLSDYAGQMGYVAIRHFDCNDKFRLNVDDIYIEQPGVDYPWTTLSTTANTITLPNLQMETSYEYQLQSVCDGTPTTWTNSNYFSTINGNIFLTDGDWNDASKWYIGAVPAEGSNVTIQANVTIPAGYTAIADNVALEDGASITIADGGQLQHNTDNLEVTMEKTVEPYTDANSTNNYKLLSFPFSNYPDVPEGMITTTGTDFYGFDNSAVNEEWQNNQVSAISYVYAGPGYLYANPEGLDLSMTGTTYASYDNYLTMTINYDENENGDNSGWRLLGNPFVCDAYIYNQDLEPMDVMYYDANGNMLTFSAGPVAPMQGFFVHVTDTTEVYFTTFELTDEETKSLPKQAISLDKKTTKTATQAINLDKSAYKNVIVFDKKADKKSIVLDKKVEKQLFNKDITPRFFKEIKKINLLKK